MRHDPGGLIDLPGDIAEVLGEQEDRQRIGDEGEDLHLVGVEHALLDRRPSATHWSEGSLATQKTSGTAIVYEGTP